MTMASGPPTKFPTATPEKSSTHNFDRFHPEMPQIPGVNDVSGHSPQSLRGTDTRRLAKIGGIICAILVIGIAILWWIKSRTAIEPSAPDAAESNISTPPL